MEATEGSGNAATENCEEWDCVQPGAIEVVFVNATRRYCPEHAREVMERCKMLKTMAEREGNYGAFSLLDTILKMAARLKVELPEPRAIMLLREIELIHLDGAASPKSV